MDTTLNRTVLPQASDETAIIPGLAKASLKPRSSCSGIRH